MTVIRERATPALFGLALIALVVPLSAGHAAPLEWSFDGVPLPADTRPLPAAASAFAGMWVGTWDGRLKTVLIVEAIASDGSAKVVYAVAENPGRFKRAWFRLDGMVAGRTLTVPTNRLSLRFTLSKSGRLRGVFGPGYSFAVLTRANLAKLRRTGAPPPWLVGKRVFLSTDLVERGKPIRLEAIVFRPKGRGPFPLAVVSHGSTGDGTDPAVAKATWTNAWLADILNERGWIVAFPHRRGRGRSDGTYDEGFAADRRKGYTCDTRRSLAGADRALDDLRAAILALRRRPDVSAAPILLAGASRGGILSLAYAGRYPAEVSGVLNFVGGWMGEACKTASDINQTLFKRAAAFKRPTLWLYGRDDIFYSMAHSRANFAAFRAAGGTGRFVELTVRGTRNGHWVIAIPPLWSLPVATYLDSLRSSSR